MNDYPQFILSDPAYLKKIKRRQYLWQIIPVLLIFTAFGIGTIQILQYPAAALAGIAAGLFIFFGAAHRYKHRLPIPPQHTFVSPLQGRTMYVRSNEELSVVNISRIFLDSVELRSPHPLAQIVENQLMVPTDAGNITFRFNKVKVEWLPEPNMIRGHVIGIVKGHGSCTISIPAQLLQISDAGNPILTRKGKPMEICQPLFTLPDPEKQDSPKAPPPEEKDLEE